MDFEYEEYLACADAAFAEKQFETALEMYLAALSKKPADLYVLSRGGSTAIVLGQTQTALDLFTKATELDPENGDNFYNLGNAYFFMQNYGQCMEMYAKAESLGCTPAVTRKLYFQKALLCNARGDARSALVYIQKYEDAFGDDIRSMDPRLYSEKVKVQIALGQFEEAETSAHKLLTLQPSAMRNYLMYFGLLMAQHKYDKAKSVLEDARSYAELTDSDVYQLNLQTAAYYVQLVEVNKDSPDLMNAYFNEALGIYLVMLDDPQLGGSKAEVALNLADLYMKTGQYELAAERLKSLLPADSIRDPLADPYEAPIVPDSDELSESENTGIAESDAAGFEPEDTSSFGFTSAAPDVSPDFGVADAAPDVSPDFGMADAVPDLSPDFGVADDSPDISENTLTDSEADPDDMDDTNKEPAPQYEEEIPDELLERARYALMSCYISQEDYEKALAAAEPLTSSANSIHKYFSLYCRAYSIRMLARTADRYTAEDGEKAYSETIAFFRSCMLRNPLDKFSVVLRIRMYAELGQYARAEELVRFVGQTERESLMRYIDSSRAENG